MNDWLVINPNTSENISEKLKECLLKRIRHLLSDEINLNVVTARFGAPYISSEAEYAVAGHAVLDAWGFHVRQPHHAENHMLQACLVGCFGDPGVSALQEMTGKPVIGLAEAAFIEASEHGRFAIVTGGERWAPMLRKLARMLEYDAHLAGIHTLAETGAELAADPVAASVLLRKACDDAAKHFNADAVILGGAGLAGLADGWIDQLDVPVIDSVDAGARQLVVRVEQAMQDLASGKEAAVPLLPHPDLLAWPGSTRGD